MHQETASPGDTRGEFLKRIYRILVYSIGPYLVFLLIIAILFRDNITLGMEYDEVLRINNIIPMLNPHAEPYNQSIFTLSLFGLSVPLMYKFYLSSALLIPYLPLILFKNNLLFGLRFLYAFYFFVSISVFYFILTKKFSPTVSFLTSVLVITSPLFYPEALIGFAHCTHLIFLSLAVYCFYLFFERNQQSIYLFFGTFLLFFEANIEAYFLWVITALIITSIIIFPHYWKIVTSSIRYLLTIVCAILLGWINFVIYNIVYPFATIRPMVLKIVDPAQYNLQPVDFTPAAPLPEDIFFKLSQLFPDLYRGYGGIYLILIAALIILNIFLIFKTVKMQEFPRYGKYFFSFICFCLIFTLILISPNTTRAGHYVYLIPFLELSIVFAFLFSEQVFRNKYIPKLLVITLISMILLNCFVSGMELARYDRIKGKEYFSPAIFDLNTYINKESLPPEDIIFFEWGMSSQLYFLHDGEFKINRVDLQFEPTNYEERKAKLAGFFALQPNPVRSDTLYFPLYTGEFDSRNTATRTDFLRFVQEQNGTITKVQAFNESYGPEVIGMYALENSSQFLKNIRTHSVTR